VDLEPGDAEERLGLPVRFFDDRPHVTAVRSRVSARIAFVRSLSGSSTRKR
jgi:hypothetical protein